MDPSTAGRKWSGSLQDRSLERRWSSNGHHCRKRLECLIKGFEACIPPKASILPLLEIASMTSKHSETLLQLSRSCKKKVLLPNSWYFIVTILHTLISEFLVLFCDFDFI